MSNELLTRSVASVIPKDLAEHKLKGGKMKLYWGIDPTGGRIHLGHSVPMRKLQAFAEAGHEAILLIGSFTAMIGDPSGQDSERKRLTKKEVEENFKNYKKQAAKVIDFKKVKVVYNNKWLDKVNFEKIIELASKFTVQQMTERKMFAERIKSNKPVYVHEFMYPLMVGYDSVHLDVDCELGGTDQEFNMLAGRTLQTALGGKDKFVLTTPLIEGTDGRKMSKTYNNCIYLDDEPEEMYGKVLSMNDDLIEAYFECCTDVPMEEVKKIMKLGPREAKGHLARTIVTMYHGEDTATAAEEEFIKVFKEGGVPEDMPEAKVVAGAKVLDVIVEHGLVPSKSEGRRVIEQRGVSIEGTVIESIDAEIAEGVCKVGKRKFLRITL